MEEILLDLKDYSQGTVFKRRAVRGIIESNNKYLVVHSKYGDCKYPGGGMEKGETMVDTLIREVKEETGYDVLLDTISEQAAYHVHEISRGDVEDIFIMDSYYFQCKVSDQQHDWYLDEYENNCEYTPDWLSLEQIHEMNSAIKDYSTLRWVPRELLITEKLLTRR